MDSKLHQKILNRIDTENYSGKKLFQNKTPEQILNHIHSHDPTTEGSYKSAAVRANVAKHGHMHHLNKLVDDPHEGVQIEVARKGNIEHLKKLADSNDIDLANYAKYRLQGGKSDINSNDFHDWLYENEDYL